jgi:hypothetical protein
VLLYPYSAVIVHVYYTVMLYDTILFKLLPGVFFLILSFTLIWAYVRWVFREICCILGVYSAVSDLLCVYDTCLLYHY